MINIVAIDHVVLRVADLQRMVRFYIDVLGARLEKEQLDIGLYQLRVGGSLVDLVPVESKLGHMGGAAPGHEAHNLDHVAFRAPLGWRGDPRPPSRPRHRRRDQLSLRRRGRGSLDLPD